MIEWEYLVMDVQNIRANCERIFTKYGIKGWELVSINNDTAYFKRPLSTASPPVAREEASRILANLSKRDDDDSKLAAIFIRNTIGIANTIENTGWQFEQGYDLIEDILKPSFMAKALSDD